MLRCSILADGKVVAETLGLNEVVLFAGFSFSLSTPTCTDAELATTYACDGLIISTPWVRQHSLRWRADSAEDASSVRHRPICPHTLTVRPVVDVQDRVMKRSFRNPIRARQWSMAGRCNCAQRPGPRRTGGTHVQTDRTARTDVLPTPVTSWLGDTFIRHGSSMHTPAASKGNGLAAMDGGALQMTQWPCFLSFRPFEFLRLA
jgi:hypothetical protein